MINLFEVNETNKMISQENLDVRTITLGISLLDCITDNLEQLNKNIYDKITTVAEKLVATGQEIEKEFGIPIVNKRISVTPIALVGGSACKYTGGFCDDRKNIRPCGKDGRREFPWRLFRSRIKGNDVRRRKSDPLDPTGACRD